MFLAENDDHWQPDSDQWMIGKKFIFTPSVERSQSEVRWLGYRHGQNYAHRVELGDEQVPIEDSYGFNQSLSRELSPMDEVFVSMEIGISKSSELAWKFDYRGAIYLFQLDVADQSLTISSTDSKFETVDIWIETKEFSEPDVLVEFSSIDQELAVLINGNAYFQKVLPDRDLPISNAPIDIGSAGGDLAINRIRIWRDLYYSPQGPGGVVGESDFRSAAGLIVLGDNVPLSVDSRSWDEPRLKESEVIGKVISN